MTQSNPTADTPRPIESDPVSGPGDRLVLNGQDRTAVAERTAAPSAPAAADPPHRPRRVSTRPATPPRQANGHGVEEVRTAEPRLVNGRVSEQGEGIARERRRPAPPAARRPRSAGGSDDAEAVDGPETEEGASAADAQPREPLTFAEVQEAHLAAARTFRDIRRTLNDSYRMIGRLNVERYELQVELAELKGLPMPERPPERSWNAAVAPAAPLAAQRLQRNRQDPLEEEELDDEKVRAIGRRRQLTLIGIIGGIALFALIYRMVGWNWLPNLTDRQAMADIAGIGILMQVFFLIFFLFRIGTLTGKGRSWLFPTAEAETFKRQRKRRRGH